MKDLGEPKSFLGITIEQNKAEKSFLIHQTNYIENILERFNMKDCKPQSIPMVTRQVNSRSNKRKIEDSEIKSDLRVEEIKRVLCREAIGSLMYLSNAIRPNITFTVNYLARKQLEPTEEDWMDVKRDFRYFRGYRGLKYRAETEELEALTDASFRVCQDPISTGG